MKIKVKTPVPSKLTKEQTIKIVKAGAYAFVSTLLTALALQLENGVELNQSLVLSALVSATNATLVAIKQLFTEG